MRIHSRIGYRSVETGDVLGYDEFPMTIEERPPATRMPTPVKPHACVRCGNVSGHSLGEATCPNCGSLYVRLIDQP